MKKFKIFLSIFFILAFIQSIYSAEFDELEKLPDGIHQGQMIFLGTAGIGMPLGDIITAEENFTKTSTYTFENEITKLIYLSHLSFTLNLSYEYIIFDYIGIKSKFGRNLIVQNTNFGSDYQSWKKTLYKNLFFTIGPTFHLTNRKQWDINLSPQIGYTYFKYNPTPIADILISNYDAPDSTTSYAISYGTDLSLLVFFSGGLVMQLSLEWTRTNIKFNNDLNSINPQTNQTFYSSDSATIDMILFCIGFGYALYH